MNPFSAGMLEVRLVVVCGLVRVGGQRMLDEAAGTVTHVQLGCRQGSDCGVH